MKRFIMNLPEDLHRRLRIYCAENDTNMADVIRGLVEEFLRKKPKRKR